MSLFRADLHMHTDYDKRRGLWHGEHPERLARAIVASGIDLFALTEHNKVTPNFFEVRNEIARLLDVEQRTTGERREVQAVLGTELAVLFGNARFHMGILFRQSFESPELPDLPAANQDVQELEAFRAAYPSVCILNHPSIRQGDPAVAADFMASGLIDGVEILNGSVFLNDQGSKHTRDACALFMDLRERQQAAYHGAPAQERNGLPRIAPIGTSDAHRGYRVGSATTEYLGNHPLDLFEAIRTGQTKAVFQGSLAACDDLRALGVPKLQKYLRWEHRERHWQSDVA